MKKAALKEWGKNDLNFTEHSRIYSAEKQMADIGLDTAKQYHYGIWKKAQELLVLE